MAPPLPPLPPEEAESCVVSVMIAPLSALPPAGFWLITLSFSPVEPCCFTVKPNDSSTCLALANDCPVTSGTVTCGVGSLPLDTVMVIVERCATDVPEAGFVLTTMPSATESEYVSSVTMLNCRSCRDLMTASLVWPARPSGTLVMPEETNIRIDVPLGCEVPAAGSVRVTLSLSTVALSSEFTLVCTLKPAASSLVLASLCDMPFTSGICAFCGPAENHTLTTEPFLAFTPPAGSCLVNVPAGSVESLSVMALNSNPAASMAASARSLVMDEVMVGTVTICSVFDLLGFSRNHAPAITHSSTITPITEPMMICFLRLALAACARCAARVCDSTFEAGT